MTFSFHPEAEDEFFEAIEYYEECRAGLGYDFSKEVYSAIDRLLDFPDAWQITDNNIRRCLIKRFPFGIVYSYDNDDIKILAVMNLHKKPEYWKHRVQDNLT